MTKIYIQAFALAILILTGLASCNKDVETDKAFTVAIHGYNIGDDQLEVTVDTAVYDQQLLRANGQLGFSTVYPYSVGKKDATITVKNKSTGKELLRETMSLESGQIEFFYNLVYINGQVLDVKPPAADTSTNKLGFYIYYPESKDPIDILLYDQNTGAMAYLAREVVPETWVYVNYVPAEGFTDKNIIGGSTVYFLKAGTMDQWAFNNDEYASQTSGHGMYIPHRNFNLGKVQPYFLRPSPQGYGVEVARLFPNTDKY